VVVVIARVVAMEEVTPAREGRAIGRARMRCSRLLDGEIADEFDLTYHAFDEPLHWRWLEVRDRWIDQRLVVGADYLLRLGPDPDAKGRWAVIGWPVANSLVPLDGADPLLIAGEEALGAARAAKNPMAFAPLLAHPVAEVVYQAAHALVAEGDRDDAEAGPIEEVLAAAADGARDESLRLELWSIVGPRVASRKVARRVIDWALEVARADPLASIRAAAVGAIVWHVERGDSATIYELLGIVAADSDDGVARAAAEIAAERGQRTDEALLKPLTTLPPERAHLVDVIRRIWRRGYSVGSKDWNG
jgi:hypothetical protein